uniref:Nuclear pore protein n=1 Tax=Ditylenchus dipsaci TaxID=166011 RepID=A0A915EGH0_9BILA
MSSIFDDILQRAEKLHTEANIGYASELPTASHMLNGDGGDSAMILDTGLADIFRQSEEMWKQKKLTRNQTDGTSALSTLKTSKDVGQLSITALPSFSTPNKTAVDTRGHGYDESSLTGDFTSGPYDSFSNKEIERYVESSFERARLEAERSFLNQQILERNRTYTPMGSARQFSIHSFNQSSSAAGGDISRLTTDLPIELNPTNSQPLEYQQNVFAQKVDAALRRNCQVLIRDALVEAVNEINDKDVSDIWEKIFAICSKPLLEEETVREMRTSKKWAEHVVNQSTKYLQEHFKNHMEAVVENNLTIAKRGGVPGSLSLIDAYLNVKQFSYAAIEDGGFYGKHPTWMVLFFCLRLGDLSSAATVAKKLFNVSHCSTLVGVISNLVNTTNIDPDVKIKLSAEWRQGSAMCRDSFKKAIYGVFLGFDCPEVNTSIEDWLWARLIFCKLHAKELVNSFKQLQNTICVEFGEEYFVGKSSNCIFYFSALLLTGQIEQAINVLFGANMLCHAVHFGILAYQLKSLVLADRVSSEILTCDVHDGTMCQLNFARVILLYVKNFELTNVSFALNYCFFLNKFELDNSVDNKGGSNLFESCVSRIVYLSQETDQILGKLNSHGERLPGLIDKFASAFNIQDVISRVAADTNSSGDALQACKLYALADRPIDAIKIVCRQLSLCINAAGGEEVYKKTVELAQWVAEKYNSRVDLGKHNITTLFTLIDLHTFFRLHKSQKHDAAVRVIQQLRFIPLDPDEVQSYVHSFDMVPEEVRPILPDVSIALMKSVVSLHESEPVGSHERAVLKIMPSLSSYTVP